MSDSVLLAKIRGSIPLLDDSVHYLDSAATSLMPGEVVDAVARYDASVRGNVGRGVHQWAEAATIAYEGARETVAASLGASARETVFTSGATASLNLLAQSMTVGFGPDDVVWLARDNHHSNIVPWQMAAKSRGFVIKWMPARAEGRVCVEQLAEALANEGRRSRIVAASAVANVTGARAPTELAGLAHGCGALLVLDGAQEMPHVLADMRSSGADFYAFSSHKCYGPTGVGVLWGLGEALEQLPPTQGGGGMVEIVEPETSTWRTPPHRFEAGTPPISQAVGLEAAFNWMGGHDWAAVGGQVDALAVDLRRRLQEIGATLLGEPQPGDAPIVSFVASVHPHDVCQVLAARGVAARGGHHCAQPLMRHLGIAGCTRLSLGPYSTAADVAAAVAGVRHAFEMLS